jgi:hypothetical protein
MQRTRVRMVLHMITHMVLLRFRKDVTPDHAARVFAELASARTKIPGITGFSCGPYSSPEGLNKGFTHGFCMTFKDAASRNVYLDHPAHEEIKKHVLACLDGGLDGVVAFDYES